jgi:voltage-gated potassium channel
MMVVIIVSLLPLNFKEETEFFYITDKITAVIFIIDYVLRWITADLGRDCKSAVAFIRYPFTPMAIIDLVSILPSLSLLNQGFKMLRVLRLIRAMRVLRVFKFVRYSKNIQIIINVIKRSKRPLLTVGVLALGYIYISALIIFNVEPDTFEDIYDAIYWAVVSLTTVGYGDIYPVSGIGRFMAMLSSVLGIAVVALPAGIITAGYMKEIEEAEEKTDRLAEKE